MRGYLTPGSRVYKKASGNHRRIACDQCVFADLAAGFARQAVDELDASGTFVVRQVTAREGDEVVGGGARPGTQFDDGEHRLAHLVVRDTDHRDVGDLRMSHQDAFDFRWVHVSAAGDDQIGAPIRDEQVAVAVEVAEIAGRKKSVAKGGAVLVLGVAVLEVHARASDVYKSELSRRAGVALFIDDADFMSRPRPADAAGFRQ